MEDEWYLKFIGMCNQNIESTEQFISSAANSANSAEKSALASNQSAFKAEALLASLDLGLENHNGILCVVYNS